MQLESSSMSRVAIRATLPTVRLSSFLDLLQAHTLPRQRNFDTHALSKDLSALEEAVERLHCTFSPSLNCTCMPVVLIHIRLWCCSCMTTWHKPEVTEQLANKAVELLLDVMLSSKYCLASRMRWGDVLRKLLRTLRKTLSLTISWQSLFTAMCTCATSPGEAYSGMTCFCPKQALSNYPLVIAEPARGGRCHCRVGSAFIASISCAPKP